MKKITISCGGLSFKAELYDTVTTRKMIKAMPFSGSANLWGEEIYFPVSISAELEDDAIEEVEVGTIAYWPPTNAFCIFFGPTPVSTSSKPRGFSAVNICGKIQGDLSGLRSISQGEKIKVDLLVGG